VSEQTERPRDDGAALGEWMPAEQIPLYLAAIAAVTALRTARGEDGLATLWWLYAAPMRLTKASYADFYGTKEVWTVVIEHPAHAAGEEARRSRRVRGR
jgi:hypothetical protein